MGIADMPHINLRIALLFLLLAAILAFGALACGSDGDSGSSGGSDAAESGGSSPAPTAPPAQPTPTPVTVQEGETDEATGMRVDEVTLDAKGLGGTAHIVITNELDVDCAGPVILVDLLNADGGVIGEMGIDGSGPQPAGEQLTYQQQYVGKSVVGARVSEITCENTGAVHGAPQSPSKKDLDDEEEE